MIPDIEARTGARFVYTPVLLGGLFKLTGNQPPMVAFGNIKNKLPYEMLKTRRFVARHRLDAFTFNPHLPVNTLQLMRGAVAAEQDGQLMACRDTSSSRVNPRRTPSTSNRTGSGPLRSTASPHVGTWPRTADYSPLDACMASGTRACRGDSYTIDGTRAAVLGLDLHVEDGFTHLRSPAARTGGRRMPHPPPSRLSVKT